MTPTELRECKVDILDALHALSEDPLEDAAEVHEAVDSLFRKLVERVTDGEEEA
jgi:hypothetical protein